MNCIGENRHSDGSLLCQEWTLCYHTNNQWTLTVVIVVVFFNFLILTVMAMSDHWLQRCLDSTFIIMQHQLESLSSHLCCCHCGKLNIYNKNPSIPSKPITLPASWEQCSAAATETHTDIIAHRCSLLFWWAHWSLAASKFSHYPAATGVQMKHAVLTLHTEKTFSLSQQVHWLKQTQNKLCATWAVQAGLWPWVHKDMAIKPQIKQVRCKLRDWKFQHYKCVSVMTVAAISLLHVHFWAVQAGE